MLIHLPPACLASEHAELEQETPRFLSAGSKSLESLQMITPLNLDLTVFDLLTEFLPKFPIMQICRLV
jgi:hypothetical protein